MGPIGTSSVVSGICSICILSYGSLASTHETGFWNNQSLAVLEPTEPLIILSNLIERLCLQDLNTVYTINNQNYKVVQKTLTLLENFLHLLLCFICYTNLCIKWKQDWGQGLRKLFFSDTVALQWTWMKDGTRKARAVSTPSPHGVHGGGTWPP